MLSTERAGIVFFDIEINSEDKVMDIGAAKASGEEFRDASPAAFGAFLRGCRYVCGHNIFRHDLEYVGQAIRDAGVLGFIDTLYLSPLCFPRKPYHRLVKDDKLYDFTENNPLNDAKKAMGLFFDEVAAFREMGWAMRLVYFGLLGQVPEFAHFFEAAGLDRGQYARESAESLESGIFFAMSGKICANAPVGEIAEKNPVELAYALALAGAMDPGSITPPWVLKNFPKVPGIIRALRSNSCRACDYCLVKLDERAGLQNFFGYRGFKRYDGMTLQQDAVRAAINRESLLAVFPTGGGKSITFQLPALMAGESETGLTVVISPLVSLMKDQTDNLETKHGITGAVTVNGSLDPIERAKALERVADGSACMLYIAPESLRSGTIGKLLLGRNVARFVIDEAHCFSSWGQDFRVDYLYIGDFIEKLQKDKGLEEGIPVSCFTATAKQSVVDDIREYFREKLGIEMSLFRAPAERHNLSYHILPEDSEDGKNLQLRQLLSVKENPTIIYVSRTKKAEELAARLAADGFRALPYHGRMDRKERTHNQDAFMQGGVDIIVATTAFGMGVDKPDVGMVIHYDISDSLENYVQEAGRAGRDESISADCYALYSDDDLNKHFYLLNQTKLSIKEIQQVWQALKTAMTNERKKGDERLRWHTNLTALEIARDAGWDTDARDVETKVRAAVSALEQSGFVRREQNMPRVFADSILSRSMEDARAVIDGSPRFDEKAKVQAGQILSSLFTAKAVKKKAEGEHRVDYLSEMHGIPTDAVVRIIDLLKQEGILADAKDLTARRDKSRRMAEKDMELHVAVEKFLWGFLESEEATYNVKDLNEEMQKRVDGAGIRHIGTIINYAEIKRLLKRRMESGKDCLTLMPYFQKSELLEKSARRHRVAKFAIAHLYENMQGDHAQFSVLELVGGFNGGHLAGGERPADSEEIEDALYYLLKIGAIHVEGGFFVVYNKMRIKRQKDNRAKFDSDDYKRMEGYYRNKTQQIHIVGEYAKMLSEDYGRAMMFVSDYFSMEYGAFEAKYFEGREEEISRNISPAKYRQLFGELDPAQLEIVNDQKTKYVVAAAGPGSGKTKLLVHKLASLCMMEDVKHEQLLMLTFSRAAATEFRHRLAALIGNAAHFIGISTFHSYAFELLGRVGALDGAEDPVLLGMFRQRLALLRDKPGIERNFKYKETGTGKETDMVPKAEELLKNGKDTTVLQAAAMLLSGDAEQSRITKTVLVLDEAQDMDWQAITLVRALMRGNPEMKIIAVGDDDQNIYGFRGSDSAHFASMLGARESKLYQLTANYRSGERIVSLANSFAGTLAGRMKSEPLRAAGGGEGDVALTVLKSKNILLPVAASLLGGPPPGSTCIIVRTNEDAHTMRALLQDGGVETEIIGTNSGFGLYNLAEIRDFAGFLGNGGPKVTDGEWERAEMSLSAKYDGTGNMERVRRLLRDFRSAVQGEKVWRSSFLEFLRDSKLQDFVGVRDSAVYVSTYHQTKGMEFDNVLLALEWYQGRQTQAQAQEERRCVFVAITRARRSLRIFEQAGNPGASVFAGLGFLRTEETVFDENEYPAPGRVVYELGHADVQLGHFAGVQKELAALRSGDRLSGVDWDGCWLGGRQLVKFSRPFSLGRYTDMRGNEKKGRGIIEKLKAGGYRPAGASVRHMVYWRDKNTGSEWLILLPQVEFRRAQ